LPGTLFGTLFNPHKYRPGGLWGPSFSVFWGNFDISSSKNDGGKLETVPKSEKCKLSGAKSKMRYLGGSEAATKLQSRASWKKKTDFFPLQSLNEHNSQPTSIQNLGFVFLVVYYMPNLSSE